MNVVDAIRRANRPGPPEHSVTLRVACAGAVVTGIAACRAEGELSWGVAAGAMTMVVVGMVVSYRTRQRPMAWIKPILAGAAVLAFVWFFRQLTGQTIYDVSTVENPLAVLFVWVQVAHAFDVPARRDLSFSLAGSASLMAVAAAQAIDISFGVYVLAWLTFGLVGLLAMWSSASHGGRIGAAGLAGTLASVVVTGTAILVVLPAPHVAGRVDFPANAGPGSQIPIPGGLAGDGRVAQLAKPGSPAGASRVGGYLGFANRLDTALRGGLDDTVVMRVRAQRPSYWVGETFDQWDGTSWKATQHGTSQLTGGSPFVVPGPAQPAPGVPSDLQTFYIVQSSPNLVFHADTAHEVWFPAGDLFYSDAGTIISPIGLGPGAIYTVQSYVNRPSPDQMRSAPSPSADPVGVRARYLQLPPGTARAQTLAETVTAHAPTTYDKVQALIGWMGAHTHYSTDIPALRPGQNTVDQFLFGSRTGYCEQISTSMAVMLRSIGIPAREAVGFVPGPYNPITDLYDVQARDAHAWVQVWFPGYGWQSFDPTAVVPLANPSPGSTLLHEATGVVVRLPWVPLGSVLGVAAGATLLVLRRRRRPATWAEQAARGIEAAGRRAGRRRAPGETLAHYATALDVLSGDASGTWRAMAGVVEAAAYGGLGPGPEEGRRLLRSVRSAAVRMPRRRMLAAGELDPTRGDARVGDVLSPAGTPAPRRSSPPPRAAGDIP